MQEMELCIFSRAAQNFYAVGDFVFGQKGQDFIKKNVIDFDVDNLLFLI